MIGQDGFCLKIFHIFVNFETLILQPTNLWIKNSFLNEIFAPNTLLQLLKAGWNLQTQIREEFNFGIPVLSSSKGENESLRTFLI